jgi:hypothetical protein
MTEDDRQERYLREIEQLLQAMEEDGVAGGTVGSGGVVMGEPNWEERTQDQRFAEKAKTHGYPLGLAKSTHWRRDRLVAELQERASKMTPADRAVHHAIHEAVAWALDAERFLGSFNRGGRGGFDVVHVDEVANHVLIWLRERGFRVVPMHPVKPVAEADPDLLLYIDIFSGMILDASTYEIYARINVGDLPFEDAANTGIINATAAAWCRNLTLSELYDGEPPPLSGHVGQYGRYGCVLLETASSDSNTTHDVCCFEYDSKHFGEFLEELVGNGSLAFVESDITDVEVVERISGLHTVSRAQLRTELDSDLDQVERKTDVDAAVEWGRRHAQLIEEHEGS